MLNIGAEMRCQPDWFKGKTREFAQRLHQLHLEGHGAGVYLV